MGLGRGEIGWDRRDRVCVVGQMGGSKEGRLLVERYDQRVGHHLAGSEKGVHCTEEWL